MNSTLEAKIKKADPTGLLCELDNTAIKSSERDDRIRMALTEIHKRCLVSIESDSYYGSYYCYSIVQSDHPPFDKWTRDMSKFQQLDWIQKNSGNSYPVFWLKISLVADFFYFKYNHWNLQKDTGRVMPSRDEKPNALWKSYEEIITEELNRAHFIYLSRVIGLEETPFVLDHDFDSISEDDPRWDDDDFMPPLIPSIVHDCLFDFFE